MFEPVAQSVYSAINSDLAIYEFGLLRHPTISHIGASPDGISEMGVMVEIKCPWKRKIQEGSVPLQYYYQMQMQLEVCELDECDYFECEFDEVATPDDPAWSKQNNPVYRGLFAEIMVNGESSYVYPPSLGMESADSYARWLSGVESTAKIVAGNNSHTYIRQHWWILKKHSTVRVRRDPTFVEETLTKLHEAWNSVARYRDNRNAYLEEVGAAKVTAATAPGTSPPKPSKRTATNTDVYTFECDEEAMMTGN